jgi:hypothetical protein
MPLQNPRFRLPQDLRRKLCQKRGRELGEFDKVSDKDPLSVLGPLSDFMSTYCFP